MPRGPRLDAPDTLHHVMVRGIDRTTIFRDDVDRADFLTRLAQGVTQGGLTVYAWALLPNHAHLLVRTGPRPLPRVMRSLLTGYAGAFNRRHHRAGHLFQNRYKSIVVEEEPYLLELVRYMHLNPLRAKVVPSLRMLDRYSWTGHSALLGTSPRSWQDTPTILAQFDRHPRRARQAYRAFVAQGIPQGRRPEFQGGGLVRSLGGWVAVQATRRAREPIAADARVLGSSAFVEALHRTAAAVPRPLHRPLPIATLVQRVATDLGVASAVLVGPTRTHTATTARQLLAYLWVEHLGQRASALARAVGQTRGNVSLAAKRGAALAPAWQAKLAEWCR